MCARVTIGLYCMRPHHCPTQAVHVATTVRCACCFRNQTTLMVPRQAAGCWMLQCCLPHRVCLCRQQRARHPRCSKLQTARCLPCRLQCHQPCLTRVSPASAPSTHCRVHHSAQNSFSRAHAAPPAPAPTHEIEGVPGAPAEPVGGVGDLLLPAGLGTACSKEQG